MVDVNDDFTAHLRDLDNDQLIQTEAAVKECLDVLYLGHAYSTMPVKVAASSANDSVQREFLRRAMFGPHVSRKRSETT